MQSGKTSHQWVGYDTKQSDGEVPVMLGLWGIQSTPSLPLLPGPLWPGVVAPDRALSIGQIEQVETKEKFRRNISGELESYLKHNYVVKTLSKE